jgi:hypothetical protein
LIAKPLTVKPSNTETRNKRITIILRFKAVLF